MKTPTNETEYRELMATIENYLQKATTQGGFSGLTPKEANVLAQLSKLAENYEDNIPLMPVRVQ